MYRKVYWNLNLKEKIIENTKNTHDARADIIMTSTILYNDHIRNSRMYYMIACKLKPKATCPYKKGKENDYVMFHLRLKHNERYPNGRIRCEVYNNCFVEDEEKVKPSCDMHDVVRQVESMGGNLNKFNKKGDN